MKVVMMETTTSENKQKSGLLMQGNDSDVDHGTVSTADPVAPEAPQKDGSVVSGVTDPASLLEGQGACGLHHSQHSHQQQQQQDTNHHHHDVPVEEVDPARSENFLEVPEQVILAQANNNNEEVVLVTAEEHVRHVSPQPLEDASAVSTSAIPEVRAAMMHAEEALGENNKPIATDENTVASAPADPNAGSASNNNIDIHDENNIGMVDDYIRSPEVQNAIVERSPGGRYVRFMEKLGSGASKDVYRAYDTQEGIEVAWNVVNLSGVPKNERNRIVNEVRLLERLHHHNIISFHGSWVNRERQEVNFVTEILSSGTLKSFINKVQVIRWKIAKRWAVQILKGLEYLHSQDPPVIHRDLKCDNIFINGTSGDLRIGDLGLSTVHKTGRVLSVLGTPEFMAPDMYEERPYDEKVDIYAFGMCMLEIFTKEIPYSECNNPAQIYKKVSSGEPPDVLKRIESKHARDFVLLCLGYRDDNGVYIRPSASDLLKHPFLVKRTTDDDEVMVDPPLRERPIPEVSETSSSPAVTPSSKRPLTQQEPPREGGVSNENPPAEFPQRMRELSRGSLDEEDGDRFEEMPESETNMKKVKVLMGRDTELKEDEDASERGRKANAESIAVADAGSADPVVRTQASIISQQTTEESAAQNPNYLVAAAVIQNENLSVRPYADDILQLVVTLPVDGQTQNVRFDFHLVEDDPVQVAKEMVADLGIPQAAVLEVSETISGLACAARMKQDRYAVRMQNQAQHGQVQNQSQQMSQQQQQLPQTGAVHHQTQDHSQLSSASPVPDYTQGNAAPMMSQNSQHQLPLTEQTHQLQGQQAQFQQNQHQQPYYQPHQQAQYAAAPSSAASGDIAQQLQQHQPEGQPQMHQQPVNQPQAHQQPVGQPQVHHYAAGQQQVYPPPAAQQQVQPQHAGQPQIRQHGAGQPQMYQQPPGQPQIQQQPPGQPQAHQLVAAQPQSHQQPAAQPQAHQMQHGYPPAASASSQHQAVPSLTGGSMRMTAGASHGHPQQQQQHIQTLQLSAQSGVQVHNVGHQAQIPCSVQPTAAQAEKSESHVPAIQNDTAQKSVVHASKSDLSKVIHQPAVVESTTPQKQLSEATSLSIESLPSVSDGLESEGDDEPDDEELASEIRKLDEDFQKNMQRAKKVFDSRMDNLQRSQIEREAQHQKTLEKHEKERADFEKRLAQEADEQQKRIEQLRKEWDRRRENLAQHTKKSAPPRQPSGNVMNGHHSADLSSDALSRPPRDLHTRSVSNASSSLSVSPVVSDRKLDANEEER